MTIRWTPGIRSSGWCPQVQDADRRDLLVGHPASTSRTRRPPKSGWSATGSSWKSWSLPARRIDVAALKRDYGPGAPPIPRYDDKLDDEIEIAQHDLDWLIPVLEEIAATVDLIERSLREKKLADAAEAIGELIGLTDQAEAHLSFGELFRLWQSYRLDAQGNLLDDDGRVYAHISEFEDGD